MKRRHAFVMAVLIGAAALAGLIAATRTAGLGRDTRSTGVTPASITARMHALDRTEAALRRALLLKPAATHATRGGKVVYVRPAPHVVTVHRAGSDEHDGERPEREGGELDD
jgi:hypothetical protein